MNVREGFSPAYDTLSNLHITPLHYFNQEVALEPLFLQRVPSLNDIDTHIERPEENIDEVLKCIAATGSKEPFTAEQTNPIGYLLQEVL